jgi:hypothetical protein
MVNPENKMQQLFSAEGMARWGLKICGMKYPKNIIEVGSPTRLYGFYILEKVSSIFRQCDS